MHISSNTSFLILLGYFNIESIFYFILTNPPSVVCCDVTPEKCAVREPGQGTAAGGDCGSDRLASGRVTKLNLMKCGSKYTWVGRDKRETAASFLDTTKDAIMVFMLFLNE